jgi:F-type H+-transporting ATPase subunit epsilon
MQIKVLTPTEIVLDIEVTQVNARGREGAFALLPSHQDYVAALIPGVLECRDSSDQIRLAAVDNGVLVKCGEAVTVCTRHAVLGDDWDHLADRVDQSFASQSEQEKQATQALAKLEAHMMQRVVQWQQYET